eukprot:713715-Hanusia_phi.AAC.1
MAELYRKTLAELHRKAAGGGESSEAREAAEQACRMLGVWRELRGSRDADEESPILTATGKGQADIIRLLAKAGWDVNERNEDGSTALHIAATLGFTHCLQGLVANNADLHARGRGERTCGHAASAGGHVEAL